MGTYRFKSVSLLLALLIAVFTTAGWTAEPAQAPGWGLQNAPVLLATPRPATPPARAINIPNVVGKKADAAEAELNKAGFTVKLGKATTTTDTHKYNTVHDQDPDGGRQVTVGSTVTLFVLIPPVGGPQAVVPNLVGRTAADAAAALGAAGFTGRLTKVHVPDRNSNGHVVSQNPPAGTSVPRNVYVDYQVGEMSAATVTPPVAVEKTRVPDIVGRDSSTAMNMLMGAGLQMNVTRNEPLGGINDRRSGQIAHQEPARGAEVTKGTVVNVRVFAGTR